MARRKLILCQFLPVSSKCTGTVHVDWLPIENDEEVGVITIKTHLRSTYERQCVQGFVGEIIELGN